MSQSTMAKQMSFFINAWKHMAELDDFLAEQAAEAARRITERFTLKQRLHTFAAATSDFRLEVIVRKESIAGENNAIHSCALLELSLPTASVSASKETYLHAVELLREATEEAMAVPPVLTRIVVRFRWARRYRCGVK
ncbi:hypothetical protein [Herbaspirillum sp. RV1423]|uniref:hypothetical protein n=1 Tax=Herbaspirillum sp. RV1423 TaxID=1443993 RepID=UPI0018CC24D2|nr:hypothetical protein [Herbaspirillum sp. RV1423]